METNAVVKIYLDRVRSWRHGRTLGGGLAKGHPVGGKLGRDGHCSERGVRLLGCGGKPGRDGFMERRRPNWTKD